MVSLLVSGIVCLLLGAGVYVGGYFTANSGESLSAVREAGPAAERFILYSKMWGPPLGAVGVIQMVVAVYSLAGRSARAPGGMEEFIPEQRDGLGPRPFEPR